MATASSAIRTLADLMNRLGDVPLNRVRFHPPPGTATVADVTHVQEKEGRLCELVEGVLLEKTVGLKESQLAVYLAMLLNAFVLAKNLGIVTGPDGTLQLLSGLVRIPDVAFINWERFPNRRRPPRGSPSGRAESGGGSAKPEQHPRRDGHQTN